MDNKESMHSNLLINSRLIYGQRLVIDIPSQASKFLQLFFQTKSLTQSDRGGENTLHRKLCFSS